MRIVIVEDEVRARQGLATVIGNIAGGHTVIAQAGDGAKGFELIQKLKPDLVFTDVEMDRMNGIEMITRLREASNDVNVVIISAYEEFDYAKSALQHGVLDYITKPIDPEEIEYCIQKAENWQQENLQKQPEAQGSVTEKEGVTFRHPCVTKALHIIQEVYVSPIRADEIAKRLRITPQYFSYLFKRDMGVSFTAYLRKYRIEIAKEMLCNNAVGVAEVGACIGYPDAKYFCRIFKSETGLSPTQYIFKHGMK